MTVTPVGLNQNVYMGQQQAATQPVQQAAPVSQPVPVGQSVPVQGNAGNPMYYPNNNSLVNLPQSPNNYDGDIFAPHIDYIEVAKQAGLYPAENPAAQPQVAVQQPQQPNQAPQQQPAQVPQQGQVPQQLPVQVVQQPVAQPVANTQQTPAFTGNPFQAQQSNDDLTNYLVTENAKAGAEKKFKLGPAIGAAAGFVAPFVCNKTRLGKVFTKDLLVKVPVMTTGGLCAGGITEGLVASAKKLGAENAESELSTPAKMDAKA